MQGNNAKGNRATIGAVLKRLTGIERQLAGLAGLIRSHRHSHSELLRGWPAIAKYAGKSPSSLMRYRNVAGFPGVRWGRHTYASPPMVDAWLLVYRQERRKQREEVRGHRATA